MSDRSPLAAMTWLEAAEHILKLEGPEMHIRDLTDRVMNLRMVNSSCKTSLETLLYRQTHKPNSKFQRVSGKMGWFKLANSSDNHYSRYSDDDDITPKAVIVRQRKRNCGEREDSDSDEDSTASSESDNQSMRWYHKYRYLKTLGKRMIMTNAGLADQLHQLEEEVETRQQEKKYLFKRLLDLQSQGNCKPLVKPVEQAKPVEPVVAVITKPRKPRLPPKPVAPKPAAVPAPTTERLIYNAIIEPKDLFSTSSSNSEDEEMMNEGGSNTSHKTKHMKDEASVGGIVARKKRVRRLQPIVLNEDGSPVFPIKLGGLQVHSLGKVVWDRPAFHNERYIWPLGFKSTRSYPSMLVPSRRCLYTCHILDGKDGPIFEMTSEEAPDSPIRASSATACHHAVLKAINAARDKQATNAGSGPEFFGFSHPSILNLIQMLSDADKCTKYKPTHFQQPLSRGKATGTRKQTTKQKLKLKPLSPVDGDPSLAPVVNQLISLNEFSSLSSDMSDSDNNLVIDTTSTL